MFAVLQTLIQLLGGERSSKSFALGAILGLGFSIAVILATFGIMDGFESTLRTGLKHSNGDLLLHSRNGFFKASDLVGQSFEKFKIAHSSAFVRSEGFVVYEESSKGVQVAGIDPISHGQVIGMDFHFDHGQVAIGKELAEVFGVKVGDELVLALPGGNREFSTLPLLSRYTVGQIVNHGIYLKDLRVVYVHRDDLQQALELNGKVNMISLNIPDQFLAHQVDHSSRVEAFKGILDQDLPTEILIRPFWQEFASLIEAVKIEKIMIGLVLQIIVVISIFNLLAFILFINEKRARELFLFKALGMPQKRLVRVWVLFALLIWLLSCGTAMVFVQLIDLALANFAIFQLPGKIYTLSQLSVQLEFKTYILVFALSLVWLLLFSGVAIWRQQRGGIMRGLRQEFQ